MSILSKFPSYDNLVRGASSTLSRFPYALTSASLGAFSFAILVEIPNEALEHALSKVVLAAALGMPMFVAMTAFAEKNRWRRKGLMSYQLIGVVLLTAYFFSLKSDIMESRPDLLRFAMLNAGLHFLVAIVPYFRGEQVLGFWQYNKHLLLRFLLATLYAATLYSGLAIALASADHLFGMNVDGESYFQLWIIVTGVFHPWVFLAGFPKDLQALNKTESYPRGLKIFTQYILLPLVGLYLTILYSYEAKIIITWNWPKGWVSQLVLWFSVVGTLSLLLLHPLRKKSGSAWIQVFSRWFFRALIPLVAMLFLAIIRRVSDYGVTEHRYIVIALATGLTIVVLYFVISKVKDIRIIPIVLCLLAFLSAFGPWGAFSVSERSQKSRLTDLLAASEMVVGGKLQTPPTTPEFDSRKNMSSIVQYLYTWHGVEAFAEWLPDSQLTIPDSINRFGGPKHIASALGFEYTPFRGPSAESDYFNLRNESVNLAIGVSDFDFMISLNYIGYDTTERRYTIGQDSCKVRFDHERVALAVNVKRLSGADDTLEFTLAEPLINLAKNQSQGSLNVERLSFTRSAQSLVAKLILMNVTGRLKTDTLKTETVDAIILLNNK